KRRVISCDSHTKGYVTIMRTRSTCVVKYDNCFQYVAPIVLGMISEKTRIIRVKSPDTAPTEISSKTISACAPTPAAPTVWDIVLRESIAERGRSILDL